ncbi:hypothetical protein NIE32_05885 [Sporolactobacillus kofuensis]|uniref:hypothetical protein n=1 Tax=Sporolactobacillus kofuensis TaxID=269672 RepID=UPI002098533F|nr:hypothetical protein [Sporolactobacillus kofuensis]MCO7175642.1 hypothetical protein [Sporolactobacillus kofuensis]
MSLLIQPIICGVSPARSSRWRLASSLFVLNQSYRFELLKKLGTKLLSPYLCIHMLQWLACRGRTVSLLIQPIICGVSPARSSRWRLASSLFVLNQSYRFELLKKLGKKLSSPYLCIHVLRWLASFFIKQCYIVKIRKKAAFAAFSGLIIFIMAF